MAKYYLKKDSFMVAEGPVILFDCPLERIKYEPEAAFKMAQIVENTWMDLNKQLEEENKQLRAKLKNYETIWTNDGEL